MKNIRGENMNKLFYNVCKEIHYKPHFEKTINGRKQKELINVSLLLTDPRKRIITFPQRSLNLRYLVGKLAFYFNGSNKLKFISHYSNFWNKVSDDKKTINSCFGKRLTRDKNRCKLDQFTYALKQLLLNRDSRRAVMVVYDKHSANPNMTDMPCIMSLQFLIRQNRLYLINTLRSNNIWYGLSYDLTLFTIIQELMLVLLRKNDEYKTLLMGSYIQNNGSLYLYEQEFKKVDNLVSMGDTYLDPAYDSKQFPLITIKTFEEISIFLEHEKNIRTGSVKTTRKLTDNFLMCLLNYLI